MEGVATTELRGDPAQFTVSIAETQHAAIVQRDICILRFCGFNRQIPPNFTAHRLLSYDDIHTGRACPLACGFEPRRLCASLRCYSLGPLGGSAREPPLPIKSKCGGKDHDEDRSECEASPSDHLNPATYPRPALVST